MVANAHVQIKRAAELQRPKLLVDAARFALNSNEVNQGLVSIVSGKGKEPAEDVLERLLDLERGTNKRRENNEATYSIAWHVELITAVLRQVKIVKEKIRVDLR